MPLFSDYEETPCSDGQPPMPSPNQSETKSEAKDKNVIFELCKKFLLSTTAHGIGRIFCADGKLKKLIWLISILAMYFVVFRTIFSVRFEIEKSLHNILQSVMEREKESRKRVF